jgi:hypothetical protein
VPVSGHLCRSRAVRRDAAAPAASPAAAPLPLRLGRSRGAGDADAQVALNGPASAWRRIAWLTSVGMVPITSSAAAVLGDSGEHRSEQASEGSSSRRGRNVDDDRRGVALERSWDSVQSASRSDRGLGWQRCHRQLRPGRYSFSFALSDCSIIARRPL